MLTEGNLRLLARESNADAMPVRRFHRALSTENQRSIFEKSACTA
eukprot:SAG31_NODE_1158_length_9605_cov_2.788555_18_plen_45_part_00